MIRFVIHTLGDTIKALNRSPNYLAVLKLDVNWEAEKLYGVEGLGPFDEF